MKQKLDKALQYAEKGWPVFPVHSTDQAGTCSCGNPQCGSPGKHPRTPSGLKNASCDADQIRQWWSAWPDANVAICTGETSGLLVLDVDVKKGARGFESLSELTTQHGELPPTLKATTPSGGEHYFFKYPQSEVRNRTSFRPGLDSRGKGGYVLACPSDIGANSYQWENDSVPLADPPDWLLAAIQAPKSSLRSTLVANPTGLQGWAEGQRNDGVFRYAAQLRGKNMSYEEASTLVLAAATRCNPPLDPSEAQQCLDSVYGRYPPGKTRPLTELGNAERFVDRFGHLIRFVPDYGDWLYWDSSCWRRATLGEVNRLAKAVVRGIYQEAEDETDESRRASIVKHAKSSERRAAIENMIRLTAVEPTIPIHSAELDRDPWLFGVRNGVIDLKSGTARDACQSKYITKQGNVDFDPEATCPLWEKFMLDIMGGDAQVVSFLQRAIGYTLTGQTSEQVLFILHGTGANGKSTFLEVIQQLMGDYTRSVASETLMAQKGRTPGGHNEDIARLKGARLAATSETEDGQVLAEALVKRMTGEDTLVARLPYAKHSLEFRPQFKVWMAANHQPIIRGDDHAIWRRIQLVPFVQTFSGEKQDKTLKQRLLSELSGILNWAIEGCLQWRSGGLAPPATIREATRQYRNEMDLLAEWMETHCVIDDPKAQTTVGKLYGSYTSWCDTNAVTPMNRRLFGRKLAGKGFTSCKIHGQRGYEGIGLTEVGFVFQQIPSLRCC